MPGVAMGSDGSTPSWPLLLSPQHHTVPLAIRTHVCSLAAISTAAIPATTSGVDRETKPPSPSWPALLSPQHQTAEPTSAHPCVLPSASVLALAMIAGAGT